MEKTEKELEQHEKTDKEHMTEMHERLAALEKHLGFHKKKSKEEVMRARSRH